MVAWNILVDSKPKPINITNAIAEPDNAMKTALGRSTGITISTLVIFGQGILLIASSGRLYAADSGSSARSIPMTPLIPTQAQPATPGQVQIARLNAGALAPDFASKGFKGETVQLADFKGKVVVLDFWATWCGPCQKSLPHTQEVAKSFKDQGVVVLAVCTSDTRANYEEWMEKNHVKYPDLTLASDPNERGAASYGDRASRKLYGVTGIPTQFIIGKDGKIAAVVVGYDQDDARLEAALARAGVKVSPDLVAKGEAQLKKE